MLSHGKLLILRDAIKLHVQFYDRAIEREKGGEEPVEVTPADQLLLRC